MIENKQKSKGRNSLDNSLLIKKINRQSRMKSKKKVINLKTKSEPSSKKMFKSKYLNHTIEHQQPIGSRKLYNPIRVSILEKKALRMSESNCEKGYDSYEEKETMSDRILAERARQFVKRLRTEKNYRQGWFLLKKKEQQKKHQSVLLKRLQQQKYKMAINKQFKMARAMQNILKHQGRINSRLSVNLDKIKQFDHRYRTQSATQDNELESLCMSVSRRRMNDQTEKVLSLQRKIKGLSAKIREMCKE